MDKIHEQYFPENPATEYVLELIKSGQARITPPLAEKRKIGDILRVGQASLQGYLCDTGRITYVNLTEIKPSLAGNYELVHRREAERVITPEGEFRYCPIPFLILKNRERDFAIGFIDVLHLIKKAI